MKKRTAFLISTAVTVAVGVAAAIFHQNRYILESDSALAFIPVILMLGIPFAATSIIGIFFDAEIAGTGNDIELWKVSLGVTILIPVVCLLGLENGWPKSWGIDPIWFVDALFALPAVINYLFALWAAFRDPNAHRHTYPTPDSTSTYTTTTTETDAFGRPTGKPF